MAKILVSDLMGTLIPDDIRILERFFAEGNYDFCTSKNISDSYTFHLLDKAFISLGRQLNPFLGNGNYLKVVTSVNSHESLDFLLNEFIIRLYESIKEYKNQVSVFFVGKSRCLYDLAKVSTIHEKNGIVYAECKNGISITILDDKVEVFEFIKKQHNLFLDRLFAIGDSEVDIPMLFKCIELGGKSSLISNQMYVGNTSENFDNILNQTVFRKMHLAEIEKEQKMEFLLKEREKIYKLLSEGKIDLDNLIKEQEFYNLLESYNRMLWYRRSKHEKISMERMNELDMYPTFTDYCNKVLVHKNNDKHFNKV